MLTLSHIKKSYKVGEFTTTALKDVSLSFRNREFVAILGKSGSGKTTALNIIGGLDRYDSGDLIIKGKHTKDFKDKDWDAYRNNSVGFVFQSYNLINHLSIVDNVELGMTLSGVSAKVKHQTATKVLEQVGLKDHLHKKPNQLSGGQQQRVAIARALANNPEILLCDEPTGALDSQTSTQIMDLIKKIASDRLVIMVTHNPDIAHQYADRIIEFEDGLVISDSHSYAPQDEANDFQLKHTKMRFFTALKLSFNNIRTKLGRTALTSFASSIGIIGIAVILSLSNGFQMQIDDFQSNALAEFPIMISQSATVLDAATMVNQQEEDNKYEEYADTDQVYLYDPSETAIVHQNKISADFLTYINDIDPEYASSIGYSYLLNLNLLRVDGDTITRVSFSGSSAASSGITSGLSTFPISLGDDETSTISSNYDLLAGSYPSSATDIILVVDSRNRVDETLLSSLGYDISESETLKYDELVKTTFQWIPNDSYYTQTGLGNFVPETDLEKIIDADGSMTLNLAGIVRVKEDSQLALLNPGIVYSDELSQQIIELSKTSEIVEAQKASDVNVMSMETISETDKEQLIGYLGGSDQPVLITIYPKDFTTKDEILSYIDSYNEGKAQEDTIVYTDLSSTISGLTKSIMDGITTVLIAFASISLVVSLIMIGIITYTSVIERTKEIGILKALGARKKDITRVFDAETFLLGVFSGLLGIAIAYLLTFPINHIIYILTDLQNVAQLQWQHALLLVVISTVLTVIGGHIPARMASRKDAVIALRSE